MANLCKSEDTRLRELFDFVAQYWAPKPRKKAAAAEEVEEEWEDEGAIEDEGEGEDAEAAEDDETEEQDTQEALVADDGDDANADLVGDDALDSMLEQGLVRSLGIRCGSPPPPSAYCPATAVQPLPPPTASSSILAGLSDDPQERLAQVEPPGRY